MRAALVCLAVLAAVSVALSAPDVPKWPKLFSLEATFRIPYEKIEMPFQVWTDSTTQRQRIDYYHGLDYWVYRFGELTTYEVFTKKDHLECKVITGNDSLVEVLPVLDGWDYLGVTTMKTFPVDHFQLVRKLGDKVNTYDFYSLQGQAVPIYFSMMGYNIVFHSHFDEYTIEYGLYLPNVAPSSVFDRPGICKASSGTSSSKTGLAARSRALLRQLFPVAPLTSSKQFDEFLATNEKACVPGRDCIRRLGNFLRNVETITSHNAQNDASYQMSLNRFADTDFEEFSSMMLAPRRSHRRPASRAARTHVVGQGVTPPPALDWRNLGAVTRVKDQGCCGSCWTYSANGALEGAHFVKHGHLVPLSEQQLVDCAWGYGHPPYDNNGCDGGMPDRAYDYVIQAGGVMKEEYYPYLMQNGLCKFNKEHVGARMSAYVNVTPGDENALKDALANHGPVSVAIQVTESMVFYGSGVFYDPTCTGKFEDLNHGVLAVGYGTTPQGADYWIVKNSWSTHWGDLGYILMARNKGNNCGIATDAVYPIVE